MTARLAAHYKESIVSIHLEGGKGCAVVLLFLFAPAIVSAFFLHSPIWLFVVPAGIVVLALIIAALPLNRKVTPEQFADELEGHLLGTAGGWDWDDTTSIAVADEQLEQLRRALPRFDSLKLQEDKDELKAIITALRRGEVPEVSPWVRPPRKKDPGDRELFVSLPTLVWRTFSGLRVWKKTKDDRG